MLKRLSIILGIVFLGKFVEGFFRVEFFVFWGLMEDMERDFFLIGNTY